MLTSKVNKLLLIALACLVLQGCADSNMTELTRYLKSDHTKGLSTPLMIRTIHLALTVSSITAMTKLYLRASALMPVE
jgi:hypothetical protein